MTTRLTFLTDAAGRLALVPAGARRPLTSLGFHPAGMTVSTPEVVPVLLSWDDHGSVAGVLDGPRHPDRWAIVPWTTGKSGHFGMAVQASGSYGDLTREVQQATTSVWRRLETSMGSTLSGHALPVEPSTMLFGSITGVLPMLTSLCKLLHDRPALRPRLDDPSRMRLFARDLGHPPMSVVQRGTGLSADTVDIHQALIGLGYMHPYSRPLASDMLPSAEVVIANVVHALEVNPHRRDRVTDRRQVERIVHEDFLDVEPWPFAALVGE